MAFNAALLLLNIVPIVIRCVLLNNKASQFLQRRIEVSTPANSFKRLLEGIELHENGISPYSGGTFHEQPTVLLLFDYLQKSWGYLLPYIFVFFDVLTAYFLGKAAECYVIKQANQQRKSGFHKDHQKAVDIKPLLLHPKDSVGIGYLVKIGYLFNPYSIASCVALTSTTWQNALLAGTAWAMITEKRFLALLFLAFAAFHGLYPFLLVVPVALWFANYHDRSRNLWWQSFIKSCVAFFVMWTALLYSCASVWGSWDFLDSTYGFLVSVPDLTPNVGLFWYFFTEMFDHFRLFFLWVFQLNLVVYLAPLALCLRDDPFVLYFEFLMLISVFKSYPCVGDAALYLALLPTWRHLFRFIRHGFIIGCTFVCTTVLGPIMWYLWIYAGSANANFYFAITLLYSTTQIFLLTDILYAHLRVQIHMKHGMKPMIDDQEAKVMLE